MDNQAKATKRPWQLLDGSSLAIVGMKNKSPWFICRTEQDEFGEANASLIVKAVNSFDKLTKDNEALLEACRCAYEALGKDKNWNISDLRLKVLGQAIANATNNK